MQTMLVSFLVGALVALAAGALSGVAIGGKAIGYEMAASMGGLYGFLSGTAATLVGTIALYFIVGGF